MWSDAHDAAHVHEMHVVLADIAALIDGAEREVFLADIARPHALAMHFIRLGELANRVSRTMWSDTPDIEWRKIANLRHLIAHDYRVDHGQLWTMATVDAVRLAKALPVPPPPAALF